MNQQSTNVAEFRVDTIMMQKYAYDVNIFIITRIMVIIPFIFPYVPNLPSKFLEQHMMYRIHISYSFYIYNLPSSMYLTIILGVKMK